MKNKKPILDERQQLINLKSIRNAFCVLVGFVTVSMLYKMIVLKTIEWEIWALVIACIVIIVTRNISGDFEEPRNIWNKPIPLGNTKKERQARIKSYLLDSAIFAVICTIMDVIFLIFNKNDNVDAELVKLFFPDLNTTSIVIVFSVISFIVMFLVSFIFEYFVGEKIKVKKYMKMCEKMNNEENDIE